MPWIDRTLAISLLTIAMSVPAVAQPKSAPAADETPPQVRELLERLDDPVVRDWLAQRRAATASGEPAPPAPARQAGDVTASDLLAGRINAIRDHLRSLVTALPTVPSELRRVGNILLADIQDYGVLSVLLLTGFVALWFGTEWLFGYATRGGRQRIESMQLNTVGGACVQSQCDLR
jgi:moderate conductance mechanosensitive channel